MNKYGKAARAGLLSLGMALAIAASAPAATPTEQRQAAMKSIGQAMKDAAAFNSGNTKYDPAKVKVILSGVSATAKKLHGQFPASSRADPKSAALPAIWANKVDFDKRLDALSKLADAASKASTQEAYKPAFLAVGATCKGCHDLYRKKAG